MSSDSRIYGYTGALSILLHGFIFFGASSFSSSPPKKQPAEILEFNLLPSPPDPPAEPDIELKKPKPKPKPKPKKRPPPPKKAKLRKPKIAPVDRAPPSNKESQKAAEKARPVFGLTLESTVNAGSSSGLSVRVGNTIMKDPEMEFTDPKDVKAYRGPPIHQVDRIPKIKKEVKAAYPEEAKKNKIEGTVVLQVEVLADGTVGNVSIIKGLGYGLDQAATSALREYEFEPATKGGVPVPFIIPAFSYEWFLDI